MRKYVTILALALLVTLSACNRGGMKPTREVDVEGQFGIAIPSNLLPCNDLHEFAPLQYADERGGYFLVGIPENKDQIAQLKVKYQLGDYANFVENTIATAFDTVNVSHRDTLEVNGLHCQTVDMFAAVVSERAPLEVYYHISVFESADRFYQLIGWTHRERQAVFGEAAKEIDCSFHELPDRLVNQQTASSAHPKLR